MPYAAPKLCAKCGKIGEHSHAAEYDRQRGSASSRGYTRNWQKASKAFLRRHPLCQCPECDDGRKWVTAATVVDHRIPHRGDMNLFWDESNWQAMSKPHHDAKTAKEDHGFGH